MKNKTKNIVSKAGVKTLAFFIALQGFFQETMNSRSPCRAFLFNIDRKGFLRRLSPNTSKTKKKRYLWLNPPTFKCQGINEFLRAIDQRWQLTI